MGISLEQYRLKVGLNDFTIRNAPSSKDRANDSKQIFSYKLVFIIAFLLITPINPQRKTLCKLQNSCYLLSHEVFIPDICDNNLNSCSITKVSIIVESI